MRVKVFVGCLLMVCGLLGAAPPAPAADLLDVRGIIQVEEDFSACGTVRFTTEQDLIVGQLSAGGWAQAAGTNLATVREAEPILAMNTDSVQVCTDGAGDTIRGLVSYTLTASGTSGDTTTYKECTKAEPTLPFSCENV